MKNPLPSLNALRALEAVGSNGTYAKAADALSVTPAAVKQLVAKLEAEVGPCLVRKGRGMELTQAARDAMPDLTAGMDHFTRGVEKLRGDHNTSTLVVTVEASFATSWLVPRLESFRAQNPELTVLVESSQEVLDLHARNADVAIRYAVETDADLLSTRLFDDLIFPACNPALADTMENLNTAPLIHWDQGHQPWAANTRKWYTWDAWYERQGSSVPEGGLRFSDYGQAVQAALAGQGIILASLPILTDVMESGLLVAPTKLRHQTDQGYDLVMTQVAAKRPAVQAFATWLKSECDHVVAKPSSHRYQL